MSENKLSLVEVCAGAGGQSLGLHKAGFSHQLAVELDASAADTLRTNLEIPVAVGDVADTALWDPREYEGVDLFAGGVPCPPFSAAGQQLGTSDERDLFAWAVEQAAVLNPRAIMLENVRGLSAPRFSAYRQRILDRLEEIGYVGRWNLLHASNFGVPQLRPRFVLVAMAAEDMKYFRWPTENADPTPTVGEALHDLMAVDGWKYADAWRDQAASIGPTLVGGSKKHGGADLGPTRAKEAWAKLGVDGRGIADRPPQRASRSFRTMPPRLTIEMAARIQGWTPSDEYVFSGRKTSQYRQIGNAFPPPVAKAIGMSIRNALNHVGEAQQGSTGEMVRVHDPIYRVLSRSALPLSMEELVSAQATLRVADVRQRLEDLARDFELLRTDDHGVEKYALGEFRGFIGQRDHHRYRFFESHRNKVS